MAHIERLTQLLRVLRQVRDEARPFDQAVWARGRTAPLLTTPVNECGTASCAAGWAARDPWFVKQGFALNDDRGCDNLSPEFRAARGSAACRMFFELSYDETEHLFSGLHTRRTIDESIKIVERFIREA